MAMFPQDKQARGGSGGVRERIVACRKRLRRERSALKGAPVGASEREAVSDATRVSAFDSRGRATEDAKTVSNSVEASVSWTGHRAVEAVDRPPPGRAGFSTEEEIVRA